MNKNNLEVRVRLGILKSVRRVFEAIVDPTVREFLAIFPEGRF